MSVPLDVHQIEFRWQPGRDLSPIASSFTGRAAPIWSGRLAGLARPATPDAARGVPAASAVYQPYRDGSAALVWRHYQADAAPLPTAPARQPLVARALIGTAAVLRADVAMALCRAGFAAGLSPRPGQVGTGTELPSLPAAQVTAAADSIAADLDDQACREDGLARLVAAAFRHGDTPLAVVLPGTDTVQPLAACPQVQLLWGLRRTAGPLLAGTGGPSLAARGWSFSTYELPPGDTEASGLASIVFRSQEPARPPQSMREETTVRPRVPPAQQDDFDRVAAILVRAYRELGGTELGRRLELIAQGGPDLAGRLAASLQQLGSRPVAPARPGTGQQAGRPAATVPPQWSGPGGADRELDGERRGRAAGAAPQKEQPARSRPPAVPLRPRRDGREEPLTLAGLLDRLSKGPGDPGFGAARDAFRGAGPASSPAERARARQQMPGRGWYLPVLSADDPFHVEDGLECVLRATVLPDLPSAEVNAQLSEWAASAPAAVIRALCAAAHHSGERAVNQVGQALQPVLSQRWLAEHGIHFQPVGQQRIVPIRGQQRRPLWQLVPNTPRSGITASLLAWLCLLLLLIIASALL